MDGLRRNTTGGALIRSAVPSGWPVGHKTGTAENETRNDIAVIWPPDRAPIVMAVLTTHDDASAAPNDTLVADAARIALTGLGVDPGRLTGPLPGSSAGPENGRWAVSIGGLPR